MRHALYFFVVRRCRSMDAWLLIASTCVTMVSVIAAAAGIDTAACLVILMFAPVVPIVAYELREIPSRYLAKHDGRTQRASHANFDI